jgi:hypothetical protein
MRHSLLKLPEEPGPKGLDGDSKGAIDEPPSVP